MAKITPDTWIDALNCMPRDVDVFFNDQIQRHVTECDPEAGYIIVVKFDAIGEKPLIENDEIVTEKLFGKVEIRRK